MAGTGPYRADHVGSFLRPLRLREAREQRHAGKISVAELRVIEEDAIREVVAMQEVAGLQSITDGEFPRAAFHTHFLLQLDGVTMAPARFETGNSSARPTIPSILTTRKLHHTKGICTEEFKFLKTLTKRTPKVTMPSPSMLHFRGGREAVDRAAYPDMAEFFADVARVWSEEIADLAALGCRYIQLDDTNLAYLCDPQQRERARARGEDPDALTHLYARMITDVFAKRPSDMTAAIHLCRGNFRSTWMAEGGYEPIAEIMLNETGIDGFFLEYDDARSGGFEPLRFLPKGKRAVLGLITTKAGKLEQVDDVRRRIDEASKFAPLDRLCLSPQCGFASTEQGNLITEDEQKKKIELVVKVAESVWGTAP